MAAKKAFAGTVEIEEHSAGAFRKNVFSLKWKLDALVGDDEDIKSPCASRASLRSENSPKIKWNLHLMNSGGGKFILTLYSCNSEAQLTVRECGKMVEYTRTGKVIQIESASNDNNLDFEFELPDWKECTAFEMTATVLEGTMCAPDNLAGMRDLFVKGQMSDFVLEAADGSEIKAHRATLAAGSEVFKTMLKPETDESKTGRVVITDSSGASLKKLVSWMYGSTPDVDRLTCQEMRELFAAAHKYQVDPMLRFLETKLRDKKPLEIGDCAEHYLFAKLYDLETEVRDVMKQVGSNYGLFDRLGGTKALYESGFETFRQFLKELAVSEMPSEKGIIRWRIPDVRDISETPVYSPAVEVRSVPWDIGVEKEAVEGSAEEKWTLGYYLYCGSRESTSPSRTCHVSATMKVIPFKHSVPTKIEKLSGTLTISGDGYGFTESQRIAMEELLDPAKGWVDPADYSLQLEVEITTKRPKFADEEESWSSEHEESSSSSSSEA